MFQSSRKLLTAAFVSGMLAAGAAPVFADPVQNIEPQQAREMMGQDGVTILDVRTRKEFAKGHVPGAVNVPLEEMTTGMTLQMHRDKKTPVLVYCKSGKRAGEASELLNKAGYEKVYNFKGVEQWPYSLALTPQDTRKIINTKKDVTVIDVRSPDEFATGHLFSAKNVPVETFKEGEALAVQPKKDAEIIVYCKSGKRADKAANILIKSGYTNVRNGLGVQQWPYSLALDPEVAKALIDQGGVTVVDVRSPEEFATGHIQGAVNIPSENFKVGQRIDKLPDHNARILVNCKSGKRASRAADILKLNGYKNVYNMMGVEQWKYGLVK